jgi:hypothetical protein
MTAIVEKRLLAVGISYTTDIQLNRLRRISQTDARLCSALPRTATGIVRERVD